MPKWWSPGDPEFAPASLPVAIGGAASATYDGKLWLFGGYTNAWGTLLASVYSYDPAQNAWTQHADLPAADSFYSKAAVVNGIAYMVGASGFYSYDLSTEAGATLTAPAGGAVDTHDLVAFGGLLYWKLATSAPQIYDPGTGLWSAGAAWGAIGADWPGASAIAVGSYIYVAHQTDFVRFEPGPNTWTVLASVPAAHSGAYRGCEHTNGEIVLAGNFDGANATGDASSYNITGGTWATIASLGTVRSAVGTAEINGRIYVAGGDQDAAHTDVVEMWGDLPPDPAPATLAVGLEVGWPPESTLAVNLSTSSDDAAKGTLRVALNTGRSPTSTLRVLLSASEPTGTVASDMSIATVGSAKISGVTFGGADSPCAADQASASVVEGFGRGRVATVEATGDADLSGISSVELSHTMVSAVGDVTTYAGTFALVPNPHGRSWRRDDGKPISVVTTRSPLDVLDSTILPELLPTDDPTDGSGNPVPALFGLDAELGDDQKTVEECEAEQSVGSSWPTRIALAISAASEALFGLVTYGSIPNAFEPVPEEYRTAGKSALQVIQEMIFLGDPRYWATPNAIHVDSRNLVAGASTDPLGFADQCDLDLEASSWRDQGPSDVGPEPLLADYLAECTAKDSGTPPPQGGTFETFTDGTYEWTTKGGEKEDYSETSHKLTKVDGQLTEELQEIKSWFKRPGLEIFGKTNITERSHAYHLICPEALVESSERVYQRKSLEDLKNFSSLLGGEPNDPNDPPWKKTTEEILFDAIPEWYTLRRTTVEQVWHAEGWLKTRTETSREFEGMIADPVESAGEIVAYNVTLLYKQSSRTETFTPVGNGLWHIDTTVRTSQPRAIYEPINPDAVQGDPDYGETELTQILTTPVTHVYVVVTDQAPPSVGCVSKTCEEILNDTLTCEERATARHAFDHAVWAARSQQARAKRVWSLRTKHLATGFYVGQTINGGVVSGVTHDVGGGRGSTTVQVWQYRT